MMVRIVDVGPTFPSIGGMWSLSGLPSTTAFRFDDPSGSALSGTSTGGSEDAPSLVGPGGTVPDRGGDEEDASMGGAVWEPYGTAGTPISPSGRSCDTLPDSTWVAAWVDSLGARSSVYALYADDAYPLGDAGDRTLVSAIYGPLADLFPEPESAPWAAPPDSSVVPAGVGVLDSDASEDIIAQLLQPLGFIASRLRFPLAPGDGGAEGTSIEMDLPLVAPIPTAATRVLRRFLQPDQQVLAWESRSNTIAVDSDTELGLWVLNGLVQTALHPDGAESDDDSFVLPTPSYEPTDLGDRSYNPVIGVLDESSPFVAGLWGGGGIIGLWLTALMPQRNAPQVASLPLNWQVCNQNETVGPFAEALVELDDRLRSAGYSRGLAGLLDDYGVTVADDLLGWIEALGTAQGQLLVLPPDILEEIDALMSESLAGSSNPLTGIPRQVRSAMTITALLTANFGASVLSSGAALLAGLAIWLVGRKVAAILEPIEDGIDELMSVYLDAIAAASTPGAAPNDLVAAVFMALPTALLWLEDLGEELGLSLDLEDIEETLVLGLDAQPFAALSAGLAGRVYQAKLEEALVEPTSVLELLELPPGVAEAASAMLEQHEATVPVWMLDPSFMAWDFHDYTAYPWYRHQTRVEGRNLSAWVQAASPLYQLVRAIDTAAAIFEAGLQAESTLLAGSGLATHRDSMGQLLTTGLAALGMSRLVEVLPGLSIPRFVGALWRQAMVDKLLLDLEADGVDLECAYELIPWMADESDRAALDGLLGALDPELGRRAYEEGLLGRVAAYDADSGEWGYYDNLDTAWNSLSCEDRLAWQAAIAVLVDRAGLQALAAVIEATASETDKPDLPDVVDEVWADSPLSEVDGITRPDAGLEPLVELEWVEEGVVSVVWEVLELSRDEIWSGPIVTTSELARFALGTVEEVAGLAVVEVGLVLESTTSASWARSPGAYR